MDFPDFQTWEFCKGKHFHDLHNSCVDFPDLQNGDFVRKKLTKLC